MRLYSVFFGRGHFKTARHSGCGMATARSTWSDLQGKSRQSGEMCKLGRKNVRRCSVVDLKGVQRQYL